MSGGGLDGHVELWVGGVNKPVGGGLSGHVELWVALQNIKKMKKKVRLITSGGGVWTAMSSYEWPHSY
jgi:hypothetical protein